MVTKYRRQYFLSTRFFILLFLSLFLILSNIIWLTRDTLPPAWDQAGHLLRSYEYFKAIERLDSSLLSDLMNISNFYPPLFYISSYPFYKISGMSSDSGCLTNSIFLIILIFSTYGIANNLYGRSTGILSSFLVSTYHVVFTHSREYLLEISLVSMVALSVYFLIKSDDFKVRKYSIAFWIASGIGMQTRWNFAFFLFPVIIYKIYRMLRTIRSNKSEIGSRIGNFFMGLIIFIIIFSPWYITNIGKILIQSSYSLSEVALVEGDPHGMNLENFIFYMKSLNEQVLSPAWLLFIVGFILYLRRYREVKDFTLFWWFTGSYIIITTITNKDNLRFSMPYIPAVAIFSTFWIKDIRSSIFKRGLIALLIILPLMQFFSSTYGLKIFPRERVSIGTFSVILYNMNPPLREDWKIEEIEKTILGENKFYNIRNMLRIIPDHPRFTRATFEYYSYINNYNEIAFVSQHNNFPEFTDYIITKTGYQGPPFSEKAYSLTEYIDSAPPQFMNIFRKLREFKLPDGSTATLYKRDIVPLPQVTAQDVINMIEDKLGTILLQFIREQEGLEINIIPYDDGESLKGRFKEISVYTKKAIIGDYSHKDIGVMVKDMKFIFHDITLNLLRLQEGKVEAISLKEVIPSGKIYAGDLREYILKEVRGIKQVDIHFKDNEVYLASSLKYSGLRVKFIPFITPENNIDVKIKRLNLSFLPIPSFIPNILLNNIHIFRQDITPCRVVLNNITIENEYLRIN